MDVMDFNSGGDITGESENGQRGEIYANDIFIGNPGDTFQIGKVYVDEIKGLGHASDFAMSRLTSEGVKSEDFNAETKHERIVAEARQKNMKGENVASDGGLENSDKVVGHGTLVSHGDSTAEEEIFEQKEVGEKVKYVVDLDVCGQDERGVVSDDLINNQGGDVMEGCTNWWDSLYIETATKFSEEESRNGDFGENCSDATTKLLESKDKVDLNSGALIPKKRGREGQTEKKGEYFVSDLVWGKVRSHPWWPGQILEPSSASDKAMKYFKKDSYLIAYFGDQSFAWNDASKILPFELHFQKMEKQSREEGFRIAVDAALDEVSRRFECGLVCGCLPESVLDRVKCQVVSNAGIQVQCSRTYGGDSFPAAVSFVPAELVHYLKSLAETLKADLSRLQFTTVRAQLLAFKRWKGCCELPAIDDKFTTNLENDAYPMALHEVELFDKAPPNIDENSEEYSPTILILNFNNFQSIPSVENLNKIFNRYGPLIELDTEILSKSKRAKIVFKRRSDADTAFSSAGKYTTFGASLISYRLKYLPKTYNKTKRRRRIKNTTPAPQSGM